MASFQDLQDQRRVDQRPGPWQRDAAAGGYSQGGRRSSLPWGMILQDFIVFDRVLWED